MKLRDWMLHFLPLTINGVLVILGAIGIIVTRNYRSLLPFVLILVSLYIAEFIVTFGYFKRRRQSHPENYIDEYSDTEILTVPNEEAIGESSDEKLRHKYTWKDIVDINGVCYAEEFEISGEMDGEDAYRIDDFYEAVAAKHNVEVDDILTYMMDNIDFDPKILPWGAAECGCYIDDEPEWLRD